jgi:riboflavin synthase alpha subunit
MFTGLVRATGKVLGTRGTPAGVELSIDVAALDVALAVGDSVCVSGACLTVTETDGRAARFDAVSETLSRTTLGRLAVGDAVNLEPSLCVGDALGGHFVSGHVDGTATLARIEPAGAGAELTFGAEARLLADVVPKGSIAIDGISLTVAALEDDRFRVAVIPHTLRATTLGRLRAGAAVNVETDMLVKAVRRVLAAGSPGGGLTEEFLRRHGFT